MHKQSAHFIVRRILRKCAVGHQENADTNARCGRVRAVHHPGLTRKPHKSWDTTTRRHLTPRPAAGVRRPRGPPVIFRISGYLYFVFQTHAYFPESANGQATPLKEPITDEEGRFRRGDHKLDVEPRDALVMVASHCRSQQVRDHASGKTRGGL
ncbi:hypothetical protein EVAR_68397_1 [Eumeta japonica]|uniref:Uncharacterized protein n=1 Tax=Eumeta variegata TaxID=151549 RepID=A0A4C2A7N9_EUMVA|nr:hypothetical protein EVAR_68397_1 [Eumeta japonica]